MPFELKQPTSTSKGILIFTHKERFLLNSIQPLVRHQLKLTADRYVIGMHWGGFHDALIRPPKHVSFHLWAKGLVSFSNLTPPPAIIHLTSRNFTPTCFTKAEISKSWDIINISRLSKIKKLDEFLAVIRRLFDRGMTPKTLLVSPMPADLNQRNCYREFFSDFDTMFSEEEQRHFTLLMIPSGDDIFPLSQESLSYLYNSSRVFTLFSEEEGEPRVVTEALSCGLPVVIRESLKGAGKDYLTPENSRQFTSLDHAADIFADLLANYNPRSVGTQALKPLLNETYSIQN
ncbi:MAG: glycosyltransferase involved in cell wall biosynthesis, partial [Candidatus Marinamargulisbacteria bacterium]